MLIARAWVIALAIACCAISNASAQSPRDREWAPLGCYEITRSGTDGGFIRVDVKNSQVRRFTALRMSATGATIRMQSVTAYYATGTAHDFNIGVTIPDGSQTAPYDLPGNSHEVRLIEVRFQSTLRSATPRTLCVDGQIARVQPNWKELGCHTVDFRRDTDAIQLRGDDIYEAVRLTTHESAIYLQNFKVKRSGNSTPETFTVNARIPQDISTRRFPLQQDGQRIREIEMTYRTAQNASGKAVVCAEGLVSAERPPERQRPLPAGWIELGCHTVDTNGGTGEIKVGREKGYFSAIEVRARENDVRLQALEVIRLNGERLALPNSDRIDRNAPPKVLVFGDNKSHHIDRVEMRYRSATRQDSQAFLCVDGQVADAPPRQDRNERRGDRRNERPDLSQNTNQSDDWKLIGCQPVQSARETDAYLIGRDEGSYRAIRFIARRNDVRLRSVKITFDSGESELFSMSEGTESTIFRDQPTREIMLGGDRRLIQRIEMNYRSGSGEYRGEAILCIQGQPGRSQSNDGNFWRREPINLRQ